MKSVAIHQKGPKAVSLNVEPAQSPVKVKSSAGKSIASYYTHQIKGRKAVVGKGNVDCISNSVANMLHPSLKGSQLKERELLLVRIT